MFPKLEADLKKLIIDLEGHAKEYEAMKHPEYDKDCELIFRGKAEAYAFSAKSLKNLLKWHGIMNEG